MKCCVIIHAVELLVVMACAANGIPCELDSIITTVVDKFNDSTAERSQIVAFKDTLMDALERFGYCTEREMHVKSMGVHPLNRDGEGINAARAQTRVETIFKSGFSNKAIEHNLIAMEDHPIKKSIEKFTLLICSRSPTYAAYKKGEVKAGTLGAGHATHGFAQVYDERPCTIPGISEDGKWNKAKLFTDKGIQKAVTIGMRYKIIRWEIDVAYPTVASIIQSALNVVQQAAEGYSTRCCVDRHVITDSIAHVLAVAKRCKKRKRTNYNEHSMFQN